MTQTHSSILRAMFSESSNEKCDFPICLTRCLSLGSFFPDKKPPFVNNLFSSFNQETQSSKKNHSAVKVNSDGTQIKVSHKCVKSATNRKRRKCLLNSDFCDRILRSSTSRIESGSRNWPTNWAKERGAESAEMIAPVSNCIIGGERLAIL